MYCFTNWILNWLQHHFLKQLLPFHAKHWWTIVGISRQISEMEKLWRFAELFAKFCANHYLHLFPEFRNRISCSLFNSIHYFVRLLIRKAALREMCRRRTYATPSGKSGISSTSAKPVWTAHWSSNLNKDYSDEDPNQPDPTTCRFRGFGTKRTRP